jgi:predicted dehydrogenase
MVASTGSQLEFVTAVSTPIRVGLIGYGYAGRVFHAPLLGAEPRMSLVAVGSSDPAKVRAELRDVQIADAEQVLAMDGIDLVVIAAPNDVHVSLARKAIEAGKHVVVDKPFALDVAEARGLIECANAHGRLLSVFHNRRWDSDYLTIGGAIRKGLIGEVLHFESHLDRFRPVVRDRWRERSAAGGGIWFDLGPHLIDQALQLFGMPRRVTADVALQRSGALTDDWAHVILDYGERRVILHTSMLVAGGVNRFIVHGTTGSMVKRAADLQEAHILAGLRPGEAGWGQDPDPLVVYDSEGTARQIEAVAGDQCNYYAGLAAALIDGGPNPVPPEEALSVMVVLEAAMRSAATGTVATVAAYDA